MTETCLSRQIGPLKVELRGDIAREVADVLDAVSQHKRISRFELVNLILQDWTDEKLHESMMVVRVTRREGCDGVLDGRGVA